MENNEINAKNSFLSLRHIEKVYPNGEKAVYDFNLEIDKNEFIVIVGPSGCGKSTTLRMIAGLEDITSGDIYLGDELLNYKPSKDRHMAIVFQSYALYPQMNVYDNIAFPLTINKYPAPIVNEVLLSCSQVRQLLGGTGLGGLQEVFSKVAAQNPKRGERAENLAALLDTELETAKLLCRLYDGIADEKKRDLAANESAVTEKWQSVLEELEKGEREKLEAKGIKLNDKFRVIDENGAEVIENRKLTRYEIKLRVYETADKLDLTPYLDKLPKELSGGQMQRVALGRAIVKNVPIFMMDEPLSNLDAKLRLTMRSEIVKLHNRINATTIYVTHDQTEAMTMATRIVVMSRGFIQQIGTPEEIYNFPDNIFVARFIGSPSMNMFEMNFDRHSNLLTFGDFKVEAGKNFTQKYDKFYADKCEEFSALNENFDAAAREKILKILSVTGDGNDIKSKKTKKKNIISRTVEFFKKLSEKAPEEELWIKEKTVAQNKLAELESYRERDGKLYVGIRPERISIEKAEAGKTYEGAYLVEPTLTELLGGEYNVHFEFCGKNMIGKLDAKYKLNAGDKIAVRFSAEDMFVFDPVTGDVIE